MGGKPSTTSAAASANVAREPGYTPTRTLDESAFAGMTSPPTLHPALSTGPQRSREARAAFDQLVQTRFPKELRFYGFENFGNTCYCNSVLQALYHSSPFRTEVEKWYQKKLSSKHHLAHKSSSSASSSAGGSTSESSPGDDEVSSESSNDRGPSLLLALAQLFHSISNGKKSSGVSSPQELVKLMQELNAQFEGNQHQDAQEFLNWLLNRLHDELKKEAIQQRQMEARLEEEEKRKKEEKNKKKDKDKDKTKSKQPPPTTLVIPTSQQSPQQQGISQFDSIPTLMAQVPPSPLDPFLPANGTGRQLFMTSKPTQLSSPLASTAAPPASKLLQALQNSLTTAANANSASAAAAAGATQSPSGAVGLALSPTAAASPKNFSFSTTAVTPNTTVTAATAAAANMPAAAAAAPQTFVQKLFEGSLLNLTRCHYCGSRTSRSEPFFDLSLEVSSDISLSAALASFSSAEQLNAEDKYRCATCLMKQEAEKSMQVRAYPPILIVHLKRFRYDETTDRMTKKMDRVTFPMEIKLHAKKDNGVNSNGEPISDPALGNSNHIPPLEFEKHIEDKLYELTAVVVHIGSSLRHGHYVSLVKVWSQWLCFDDDDIHLWTVDDVKTCFGSAYTGEKNGHFDGYLLFYSQVDLELD